MHVAITQSLYIRGSNVNGRLNVHIVQGWMTYVRLGQVSVDIAEVEGLFIKMICYGPILTEARIKLSFNYKTML